MAVNDHGLEAIRKSAEQVTPGDASDYYFKVRLDVPTPDYYGSFASPILISAAGITPGDPQKTSLHMFVASTGGAVTVTGNPAIDDGTWVGQELTLEGCSDTDYLILNHGNGLVQNGPVTLKLGSMITYRWNGTYWVEKGRNDI